MSKKKSGRRRNKKGHFVKRGGKRKSKRRSPKRRAAARGMRRDSKGHFIGKKGRRKGKGRKRGHGRRSSFIGARGRARARRYASQAGANSRALLKSAVAQFVARGYSKSQARKAAKRYIRILKHRAAKSAAGPTQSERIAAAMQAAYAHKAYN